MHGRPDNLHPSTELHHTSTSAHLRSFDLNNAGRDFIVGDIHGHFEQLEALLLRHRFNPSLDRVFCTGDLIDRGPFSEQAVDWLKHPWFHAVRGNHEQMVLDHAAGTGDAARHARNGGAWFYQLDAKRQQIVIDALAKLPMAIEVAVGNQRKIGVIHAELPGWEDQLDWNSAVALLCSEHTPTRLAAYQQAMYSRTRITRQDPTPISGVERLYVGHSTVPGITELGNVVYVDTGCSFPDGALSAVQLRIKG